MQIDTTAQKTRLMTREIMHKAIYHITLGITRERALDVTNDAVWCDTEGLIRDAEEATQSAIDKVIR